MEEKEIVDCDKEDFNLNSTKFETLLLLLQHSSPFLLPTDLQFEWRRSVWWNTEENHGIMPPESLVGGIAAVAWWCTTAKTSIINGQKTWVRMTRSASFNVLSATYV